MPPLVLQIISILSLINTAAPEVTKIYGWARDTINMLFNGGLITVEQQLSLRLWADEHEAATLAGETPPEWQVRPDPS